MADRDAVQSELLCTCQHAQGMHVNGHGACLYCQRRNCKQFKQQAIVVELDEATPPYGLALPWGKP